MKKTETNKMNSFTGSEAVMVRNESIWKGDELVRKAFDPIRSQLLLVSKYYGSQTKNGKSGTIIKSKNKVDLINISLKISTSGVSYAVGKNDMPLEAALKLTKSQLYAYPQVTLHFMLSNFYETVLPLKNSLKHLDKDDFEKMEKYLKNFKDSLPLTVVNKGETKTATMNIGETIKTINEMFLTLDKHIAPYKYLYPDFYNDYMNSRKVIDLRGKSKKTKSQAA